MRKRLAATIGATLALSVVQASVIGAPARPIARPSPLTAMGQCLNPPPSTAGQGGIETAVVSTTTGVVSRVYTKNPELCHQLQDVITSGSASWVMLMNLSSGRYYQVGNKKVPGDTCPHMYMEYNDDPTFVRDVSPTCTSSSTWHRFDLKKINGLWYARVFLDSTNQLLYSAEYNPPILWSIAESQYASEVLNGGKDQSGGLSASRLTFDAARWYTSTGTIVWADMQGSERVCILCPPYHSQWYDGNTFEVWTDAST